MQHLYIRSMIASIFILFSSFGHAGFLSDDFTYSFGLSRHQFQMLSMTTSSDVFISQNYKDNAPVFEMRSDKYHSDRWSTRIVLSTQYDLSLESQIELGNGRVIFDARSWSGELKFYALYHSDLKHKVAVGIGAGVKNFALKTLDYPDADYVNYIQLMAPIIYIEKKYSWLGLPSCISFNTSYLDIGDYAFSGYSIENQIWIYQSPEVEQGLRVVYTYSNIDLGTFFRRKNTANFHGLSWCMELKFH